MVTQPLPWGASSGVNNPFCKQYFQISNLNPRRGTCLHCQHCQHQLPALPALPAPAACTASTNCLHQLPALTAVCPVGCAPCGPPLYAWRGARPPHSAHPHQSCRAAGGWGRAGLGGLLRSPSHSYFPLVFLLWFGPSKNAP